LTNDVEEMKSSIEEIKQLLKDLVNGPRWPKTWNYF
jgi:hypothetical protein